MQLLITAPTAPVATATADIKWISKGGSSIDSADGAYRLRKNSKGEWRILAADGDLLGVTATKDRAKEDAAAHLAASTGPATDLRSALTTGDAKVYSLRGDGTMRRRHFLTGAELVAAQSVKAKRDQGLGLAFIANELHSSVSHVRRMLVDLAITEELQEMEADELAALFQGAAE